MFNESNENIDEDAFRKKKGIFSTKKSLRSEKKKNFKMLFVTEYIQQAFFLDDNHVEIMEELTNDLAFIPNGRNCQNGIKCFKNSGEFKSAKILIFRKSCS